MIDADVMDVLKSLAQLANCADSRTEYSNRLTLSGEVNSQVRGALLECASKVEGAGLSEAVEFLLEDDAFEPEELPDVLDQEDLHDSWVVKCSKPKILKSCENPDFRLVLFVLSGEAEKWIRQFSLRQVSEEGASNKFTSDTPIWLLVGDDIEPLKGPRIRVSSWSKAGKDFDGGWSPSDPPVDRRLIVQSVFVQQGAQIVVDPARFWAESYGNDPVSITAREVTAEHCAAALSDEVTGHGTVIINGVRRLEKQLVGKDDYVVSEGCVQALFCAIRWVYEERPATRLRLIADRLTIEASNNESFLACACRSIDDSLKQSKEKYKYVIAERRTEYAKEFTGLLKDLRDQSQAYAQQIRGIVSSLLRDVLAALFLIGIGVLSRVPVQEFANSDLVQVLFRLFSGYLILSYLLQVVMSFRELRLSDQENSEWADAMREHMSADQFRDLQQGAKGGRRRYFWWTVGGLGLIYLLVAVGAWNVLSVLSWIGVVEDVAGGQIGSDTAFIG